jgi:putative oxidoreductase
MLLEGAEMISLTNAGVDWLLLAGRLCLAVVFAASAATKFERQPSEIQVVSNLHIPAPATLLVLIGAFETIGGLALVVGIYSRVSSALLALFMITISFAVLGFWSLRDPPQVRAQKRTAFVSNIGIIGGLICLIAAGPGRFAMLP